MKLYCIASGSSGNCLYFETGETAVLVDAGVSSKRICNAITEAGLRYPEAVFITHEHSDHISGLEVFLKSHPIPVLSTKGTLSAIAATFKGTVPMNLFYKIVPGKTYTFKDLSVTAHSMPHDAADPVFYTLESNGQKASVMTDIGALTDELVEAGSGSNLLYLESNHDPNILMAGSYPYSLKQRILGKFGHLSNDSAAELAVKLMNPKLHNIVLGHLSKENNYAELAFETMRSAIESAWCFGENMPHIEVANRDIPTGPLEI